MGVPLSMQGLMPSISESDRNPGSIRVSHDYLNASIDQALGGRLAMIPTYFLILAFLAMVMAAAALWIFHQTDEDVYRVLAIIIAAIYFIVGFAHSPWAVQVVITLGLLVLDRLYTGGWMGQRRL